MKLDLGQCAICKNQTQQIVTPLHGDHGGPLVCPICCGKWHAEHGRKRRAGRVVIRAIKAFIEAGGKLNDVTNLAYSTLHGWYGFDIDPLGYMAGAINTDGEAVDLSLELLEDAVRLAHPDCHPPERHELAKSVTQGLLELKPFVFPAQKPKVVELKTHNGFSKLSRGNFKEPLQKQTYPCNECRSEAPYYYCTACRAEWEKRYREEREQENRKQREQYARRKARLAFKRPLDVCAVCGTEFKDKRKDARFCSNACRQKAHRLTRHLQLDKFKLACSIDEARQ
jgi:hypothetical protein